MEAWRCATRPAVPVCMVTSQRVATQSAACGENSWACSDARYVPETAAQRLCGEVGVLGSGAEK